MNEKFAFTKYPTLEDNPDVYDIYSVEGQKRTIQHPDEENPINFIGNFPNNIEEAVQLENLTGGLNLFINFNFQTKIQNQKKYLLQSNQGDIVASNLNNETYNKNLRKDRDEFYSKENEQNKEVKIEKNGLIPIEQSILPEFKIHDPLSELNHKPSKDLLEFYRERNLLLDFMIEKDKSESEIVVQFLEELTFNFKF